MAKDHDKWNKKGAKLFAINKFKEAIECYNNALEINTSYIKAWYNKGLALESLKKYQEAIDAFKKVGSKGDIKNLAYTYALIGEREMAEKTLQELIEQKKEGGGSCHIALQYIALGEYDKAFEWLDRAYEEHDMFLVWLKSDYEYDPIRSDPRYTVLLKKMGLPPD